MIMDPFAMLSNYNNKIKQERTSGRLATIMTYRIAGVGSAGVRLPGEAWINSFLLGQPLITTNLLSLGLHPGLLPLALASLRLLTY